MRQIQPLSITRWDNDDTAIAITVYMSAFMAIAPNCACVSTAVRIDRAIL